jgi:hypothetical protein
MGYSHGEKPMSGEESIGPASVIGVALTLARALLPPAQNSPQATANEAIKGTEDELVGMFEICKPPSERGIDVFDDAVETVTSGTASSLTEFLFECLQAFGTHGAST